MYNRITYWSSKWVKGEVFDCIVGSASSRKGKELRVEKKTDWQVRGEDSDDSDEEYEDDPEKAVV